MDIVYEVIRYRKIELREVTARRFVGAIGAIDYVVTSRGRIYALDAIITRPCVRGTIYCIINLYVQIKNQHK